MKMIDKIRIEAPRQYVFAALNDPNILRQSIPGCQNLEQTSETELTATVQAKVGPVKATFQGAVTLSEIKAPESYTISGEGKGGAAGFAKGTARITLIEDGNETILNYEVDAEVGGKLAQVGSRLIEGSSKKLASQFFETFSDLVGTQKETQEHPASDDIAAPAAWPPVPFLLWVEASILALILLFGITS